MRRAFGDALISLGALACLLLVLVASNDRVRQQVSLRFGSGPHGSADLVNAGTQVSDLVTVIAQAARDQSLDHAPLMIFVLAASVLVLFMLRT
jgi:hypothetical protein